MNERVKVRMVRNTKERQAATNLSVLSRLMGKRRSRRRRRRRAQDIQATNLSLPLIILIG